MYIGYQVLLEVMQFKRVGHSSKVLPLSFLAITELSKELSCCFVSLPLAFPLFCLLFNFSVEYGFFMVPLRAYLELKVPWGS